ncbi:MAG: hypothetical protein H0U39_00590 [Segetibacter sp.]|nr:hypothetical protein [Segetibacter sp.]
MIPVKQLIYKKTICIIGLLFMWQLVVKAQTAVIPQPLNMRITSEQMLAINSGMYIVYDAKLSAEANLLSQEIKKITGTSVKLSPIQTKTTIHNTIYLKLEKATTPDAESYRLQINDNGVMITASNAAGIFMAVLPYNNY